MWKYIKYLCSPILYPEEEIHPGRDLGIHTPLAPALSRTSIESHFKG